MLDGILEAAAPAAADRVLEIGPGLGILTRGLPRRRRGRDGGRAGSGPRRLAADVVRRRDRRCPPAPRRGRLPGPGPRGPRRTAVPGRREPAVPHHESDAASSAGPCRQAGPDGPDGPARGRGTDRRSRRRDELPVRVRPVPRRRRDGDGGAPPARSSLRRRSTRRSSASRHALPTTPGAFRPTRRTASGGSSRRRSANDARCSTTSSRDSCGSTPRASSRRWPPPESPATGDPRRSNVEEWLRLRVALGPLPEDRRGRHGEALPDPDAGTTAAAADRR